MAIYDCRRGLVGWAAGLFLGILLLCAFYPALIGMEGLDELVAGYPEALLSLFGIEPGADFTTAVGYLESEVFSFIVPLSLIGFGVAVGARFVAGEEERGTIGLTLARPVARWRFVVGRAVALALLTTVLGGVVLLALLLAGPLFALEVPLDNLAAAVAATTALAVLFGWVALAAGAASGARAAAGAAGWGLAVLAYLWNGLAPLTSGLTGLAWLSPYEWAMGAHPLRTGFDPTGLGSLAIASAAVLVLGVLAFDRRDLAG
jgi:ABC-2 type transport system permease protein